MAETRDSYGRTIHELLDLQKKDGWKPWSGVDYVGCEDPNCPDWQVAQGAWWEHSHQRVS